MREFDEAFDRIATALSEVYLVDSGDGPGIKGAPISMSRYFDPWREHTIVVFPQAWHPDVPRILFEQVQSLPAGWKFAIDASEFPPGQAHIVVGADGVIHGWSDFSARSTLTAFGFPALKGPLKCALFGIVSMMDDILGSYRLRRLLKRAKNTRLEDMVHIDKD